jgi:hypothetical protein
LSEDSQFKPPTLLEICGPLMTSYPAANHLQYGFKVEEGVTCLVFLHRAMGSILREHRDGLPKGWEHWLKRIRELAQRRVAMAYRRLPGKASFARNRVFELHARRRNSLP